MLNEAERPSRDNTGLRSRREKLMDFAGGHAQNGLPASG
jgi:hypothetical protein